VNYRFSSLAAALIATGVIAACTAKQQDTTTGTNTGGDAGAGTDSGNGGTNDAGPGGSDGGGTDGGGGGGAITSCTDAVLFSGDPYFSGTLAGWVPAGQPKTADPPIRTEGIAVAGSIVYYQTNYEIWRTDGANVKRVAGDETEPTTQYNPTGTCAASRFINIQGLAALPNGNVLVVDNDANGIVEIKDPTGTCTVAPFAGNPNKTLQTAISGDLFSPGDVIGAGATAQFNGLTIITTDPQGNAYVSDGGNNKIKKIANDASHTVSTLYAYSSANMGVVTGLTVLNGKLYVVGETLSSDRLWEIDTTSGAFKELYQGTGIYPDVDPSSIADATGLTNDGTSLIISVGKGWLYRVGIDGKNPLRLAGSGPIIDFPPGLSLTAPIPAAQLPMRAPSSVYHPGVARMGSDILVMSTNGLGFHVWDLRCK
jgi:hypothetical protein